MRAFSAPWLTLRPLKQPASRPPERPDQQGRFSTKGLPAGHYLAIAVDVVEEGQSSDPEFLEQIRSDATPFDLGDGERKALALKLVSSR